MKKIELLAPAGNLEKMKIAIANGADAVYLGIDEFNARANEDNFTIETLAMGINHAHLFGVKVYLALNILFKDDEIPFAMEIVDKAIRFGVDAFIVQDIAIASLIKNTYPNAVLHASTQMGCSNLESAKLLKSLGFSRIVLARETGLEDIKLIKNNLDIEIEYFIQGALCVSYSGNCYLCSLLTDASGNRGKCKQFCRLPCQLCGNGINKKGYFLSTKDICMLGKLQELALCGVDSFKIEGRARRSGYVGRATKVYRDAIDNNFKFSEQNILSLKKVFNRGDYSQGYLSGEKIIYSKVQNHMGVEIGKVIKINKGKRFNEIFISSSHEISKKDLLKFFDGDIERGVVSVEDVKRVDENVYRITSTFLPQKADSVRLILDAKDDEEILSAKREIPFVAKFYGKEGKRAKLVLSCQGSEVEEISDLILEKAKTSSLSENDVRQSLNKIGSPFYLQSLDCELGDVFMVKSALNSLRRAVEDKLKAKIISDYKIKNNLIYIKNEEKVELFNKKQLIKKYYLTNSIKFPEGFDGYILNPDILNEDIFLDLDFKGKEIYLSTSVFASQKEVEYYKKILKKYPKLGIYANNYYALFLTEKDKTIIGDGLNVFNSYAIKFYVDMGFKNIVVTKENINLNTLFSSGANLIYLSSYYPEYMNFAHCPVKENIGGNCGNCKYKKGFVYKISGKEFEILRRKIISCHFVLKGIDKINKKYDGLSEIIEEN